MDGWLQAVYGIHQTWQLWPTTGSGSSQTVYATRPHWAQPVETSLGSPDIRRTGNLQPRHSVPVKWRVDTSNSSLRVHRRTPRASLKLGVCQKGPKASKKVNMTFVAAGERVHHRPLRPQPSERHVTLSHTLGEREKATKTARFYLAPSRKLQAPCRSQPPPPSHPRPRQTVQSFMRAEQCLLCATYFLPGLSLKPITQHQ